MSEQSRESIETVESLMAYFRRELIEAFETLDEEPTEPTEAYLVRLLDAFSRSKSESTEALGFDKPAAIMLGEAMNSPGEQRIEAYRKLGDASLFNCGFFKAYLTRRLVDEDYYYGVGRLAYKNLRDLMSSKTQSGEPDMFTEIFDELTVKFDTVVEAFQRLGQRMRHDDVDISAVATLSSGGDFAATGDATPESVDQMTAPTALGPTSSEDGG